MRCLWKRVNGRKIGMIQIDFYIQNQYTHCFGEKGRKHQFGDVYMDDYYVFGSDVKVHDCVLCGKEVPASPRPGDYK